MKFLYSHCFEANGWLSVGWVWWLWPVARGKRLFSLFRYNNNKKFVRGQSILLATTCVRNSLIRGKCTKSEHYYEFWYTHIVSWYCHLSYSFQPTKKVYLHIQNKYLFRTELRASRQNKLKTEKNKLFSFCIKKTIKYVINVVVAVFVT